MGGGTSHQADLVTCLICERISSRNILAPELSWFTTLDCVHFHALNCRDSKHFDGDDSNDLSDYLSPHLMDLAREVMALIG